MHILATAALSTVYFGCVLVGVPIAGPLVAPWFLAVLSAAFVWCYVAFARGRPRVALAVVFIVTLVFPIGALIAIGWPVYRSWSALSASFWEAFQERGALGVIELVAPMVAAACCAGVLGSARSKIAVAHDSPSASRLP